MVQYGYIYAFVLVVYIKNGEEVVNILTNLAFFQAHAFDVYIRNGFGVHIH